MLKKPPSCQGCPMYGDGKGWVPDELVKDAPVFVLAQNPGSTEEQEGRPLVGATGRLMEQKFFPQAKLVRGENVSLANVLKCRWINNGRRTNDLPPAKILKPAVEHCTKAHLVIPAGVLVVAMGKLANEHMGCPGSVSSWRGFTYGG